MTMSPIKLGLAVFWPGFWTGVPLKLILCLLFLSMHVHPWEGAGLVFLLILSIPIDIWAYGVSARTVFLERLRLRPPEGLGLAVFIRFAVLTAVYGPMAYAVQGAVKGGAQAAVTHLLEMEWLKHLPVAERISLELTLWSSVWTIVLVLLGLGWLYLFGKLLARQARAAEASPEPYQALVRQWDLMRVPADQPLLLAVFSLTVIVLVFLFWSFIPVSTPHPHPEYQMPEVKTEAQVRPLEALEKVEKVLAQAEPALKALEEEQGKGGKAKRQGKDKGKKAQAPAAVPPAAQTQGSGVPASPASAVTPEHGGGDHAH